MNLEKEGKSFEVDAKIGDCTKCKAVHFDDASAKVLLELGYIKPKVN